MPSKRKQSVQPQTVCPLTKFEIDGRLKKRLKSSPTVTEKTVKNVMENKLGVAPPPTNEMDEIINAYVDALIRQLPSASAAAPAAPDSPAAVIPTPDVVPKPRGRTASTKKVADAVPAKAVSMPAIVVEKPATMPSPQKVAPKQTTSTRQRKKPVVDLSPERSSPAEQPIVSSPKAKKVATPEPHSPAAWAASPKSTPAKRKNSDAAMMKSEEEDAGGGWMGKAFMVVVVVSILAWLLVVGVPRVQKHLPQLLAGPLEKSRDGVLVVADVASKKVSSNYNWVTVESTKLLDSARTAFLGLFPATTTDSNQPAPEASKTAPPQIQADTSKQSAEAPKSGKDTKDKQSGSATATATAAEDTDKKPHKVSEDARKEDASKQARESATSTEAPRQAKAGGTGDGEASSKASSTSADVKAESQSSSAGAQQQASDSKDDAATAHKVGGATGDDATGDAKQATATATTDDATGKETQQGDATEEGAKKKKKKSKKKAEVTEEDAHADEDVDPLKAPCSKFALFDCDAKYGDTQHDECVARQKECDEKAASVSG